MPPLEEVEVAPGATPTRSACVDRATGPRVALGPVVRDRKSACFWLSPSRATRVHPVGSRPSRRAPSSSAFDDLPVAVGRTRRDPARPFAVRRVSHRFVVSMAVTFWGRSGAAQVHGGGSPSRFTAVTAFGMRLWVVKCEPPSKFVIVECGAVGHCRHGFRA